MSILMILLSVHRLRTCHWYSVPKIFILADNIYRTITLNLTAIVLLRIRDTRQVSLFGKTFLNNDKITDFIALFKKLVYDDGNYGYLLFDFTKFSESPLALRTHIIEDGGHDRAFTLATI